MVGRTQFLNKLKELGYQYKTRQKRTDLYRKKGGQHRMFVPFNVDIDDETVTSLLRQAGCKDEEIKKFLASAKS